MNWVVLMTNLNKYLGDLFDSSHAQIRLVSIIRLTGGRKALASSSSIYVLLEVLRAAFLPAALQATPLTNLCKMRNALEQES